MRLTTKIRYGLARWLRKASALGVVSPWISASFLEPSFRNLTKEGYQKCSAFFACVSALAFAFPEAPLLVWDDESNGAQPLERHPLRQLLRNPNPRMGERKMAIWTMAYLAIGGNCYLHRVRDRAGRTVQLWPYHAGAILPVPGGPEWISHYTFDDGSGTLQVVPVEDIIHLVWPSPDPLQPWMAQPPLLAASREIDSDVEVTRFLKAVLQNDAVPRGVLQLPADSAITPDERDRMKEQWAERYGSENRGKIAILEGGATYQRIGLNLQELAFEALQAVPEARIAAAMRVPPIIAGLNIGLARATFANYGEARKAFAQDTMAPLWSIVGDTIQSAMSDEYPGVVVRHDLSRVQALQEDVNAKWTRVLNAFNAGILEDENEARGLLSLPPMAIKPKPAPALPPSLPNAQATQEEPAPPKALRVTPETKSRRSALQTARSLQRARREVGKRFESAIESYFSDLAATIMGRARERKADALPTLDALWQRADDDALRTIFARYTSEIANASWDALNGALGLDVAFEQSDPAVVAALAESGANVGGISETTRSALRELLQFAASEGWSIAELVDGVGDQAGIGDVVAETYRNRARAIARTELGTAQQRVALGRYEATGVERVIVFDGGSDDSDADCNALNGQRKSVSWARKNLLGHPNCVRCFAPVFD